MRVTGVGEGNFRVKQQANTSRISHTFAVTERPKRTRYYMYFWAVAGINSSVQSECCLWHNSDASLLRDRSALGCIHCL